MSRLKELDLHVNGRRNSRGGVIGRAGLVAARGRKGSLERSVPELGRFRSDDDPGYQHVSGRDVESCLLCGKRNARVLDNERVRFMRCCGGRI